jgi:hypothetical protein
VVDRPAHLSTLSLGLLQHRLEGLGLDPKRRCAPPRIALLLHFIPIHHRKWDREFESGLLQQ